MFSAFIDTCVWQHWFTFRSKPENLHGKEEIRKHSESFDQIYQLVKSSPEQAQFLFNCKIMNELNETGRAEFERLVMPFSKKVPIPLSRFDGAYLADGSILSGGRMGGTLKELLDADGQDHEQKLKDAAVSLSAHESLFKKNPRKKEFDIEHMESALEACADVFLTNDEKTILNPLRRIAAQKAPDHPIHLMCSIAKTPTDALDDFRQRFGG